MYGPTKTAHWATLGFLAVALLVLSGLAWASVASLRLEQNTLAAQADKDLADKLNMAMYRLDGRIANALGRESEREYFEYTSYYVTQTVHLPGRVELAEDPLQESRLLDISDLEPWIRLHFMYTDYGGWTSPQVPSPQKWPQIDVVTPTGPAARQREELLRRLRLSESVNLFAAAIDSAAQGDRSLSEDHTKIVSVPQPELGVPKVLECEPASSLSIVVGQHAMPPDTLGQTDFYEVVVGGLVDVWLQLPESDQPVLAMVRRVKAGNILAYQGFIVDWQHLVRELPSAAKLHDLFASARLAPDFDPVPSAEPLMTRLPLRLEVSDAAAVADKSAWTSMRITVAFAWITALIALVAVGLGVRGLVALTARRTEFTYAVTHELRTPLTTFQLYTDMLSAGLVPPEKQAAYLQTLNEESRRLSELVAEVLEFSRIESNAVRTNTGTHTIGELLESIRERYASRCAAAGVQLALDANGSSERRVETDLHIALQILGTLIDNACKYASAPSRGGAAEPPRVSISAHPAAHKLAIEVADNGPGIPPADRHDLFKPFRRGSQAQGSKVGGVGLGLALAKRWSRLIDAHLELVDRARGACFRLTLPAPDA